MGRKLTGFNPDWETPPGATLRDILEERGVSQAALAREMGRPLKTINEIIQGKAAITAETALQLEDALGNSAEFWMRRESNYRLRLARKARKP
jgi:HTH-type transcriptional regulator/antitoxin HigA